MTEDTIRVEVWNGRFDNEDWRDPDEIIEIEDGHTYLFLDNPHYHGSYGFRIHKEDRPATLYVHTNDSVRSPPGYDTHVERGYWDPAIERGLTYREDLNYDEVPFGCEIWGRILFYVESEEE